MLAAVEPGIAEGLRALEEELAKGEGSPEALTQTIRTVGRQIAEGVRAGVVDGMRSRDRHLAQLAVIDRAAAHASTLTQLQERIDKELALAGLRRISDLSDLSTFNVADGTGMPASTLSDDDVFELVSPAYADAETGRTLERGWIRPLRDRQSAAPAGKRHGSAARKSKDRRSDSADADAPPADVEAQAKPEHDQVQGDATVAQLRQDVQEPEDQGRPESATSTTRSEPAVTASQPTEEAVAEDADGRADSTSRADAPETVAHRQSSVPVEDAEESVVPAVVSPSGRKAPRRSAARAPGSVGSVSIPGRLRARQTPGKAADKDNQSPRRTS
ncbi:hypothetical protein ACIBMX_03635 [Streptomyces phaeochromogenes]|uniref:hypothetical protein n=1 Tax=Streptomyces phaeochromogenes TaxID=1923 RepID=UPI0034026F85